MPTSDARAASRGRLWLGLLVLYIVWGSTYLGIAVAVETIPRSSWRGPASPSQGSCS